MHHTLEKLRMRLEQSVTIGEPFWKELINNATLIKLKKNEHLVLNGSLNKNYFFVGHGSLKTSIITDRGDKRTVWFHFDSLFEFGTTVDSYFLDIPTKYEVVALENSTLIRFTKRATESLLSKYAEFSSFYVADMIKDFVTVHEFRSLQLVLSPLEFFNYIKDNYSVMIERTSSKDIAHFIGISPEWYSKLKKK